MFDPIQEDTGKWNSVNIRIPRGIECLEITIKETNLEQKEDHQPITNDFFFKKGTMANKRIPSPLWKSLSSWSYSRSFLLEVVCSKRTEVTAAVDLVIKVTEIPKGRCDVTPSDIRNVPEVNEGLDQVDNEEIHWELVIRRVLERTRTVHNLHWPFQSPFVIIRARPLWGSALLGGWEVLMTSEMGWAMHDNVLRP